MTIFDACGQLFQWFSEKNIFEMNSNFKDIFPISEDENKDKAILKAALKDLVKMEMVVEEEVAGNTYYILRKPLDSMEQDIQVSHSLAMRISEIINRFCEKINDDRDQCDWKNITEKDITNLANIISYYYSIEEGSSEESSGEESS